MIVSYAVSYLHRESSLGPAFNYKVFTNCELNFSNTKIQWTQQKDWGQACPFDRLGLVC